MFFKNSLLAWWWLSFGALLSGQFFPYLSIPMSGSLKGQALTEPTAASAKYLFIYILKINYRYSSSYCLNIKNIIYWMRNLETYRSIGQLFPFLK